MPGQTATQVQRDLETAKNAIISGFLYPDEAKMQALELLEQTPSDETIEILKAGLEILAIPLKGHKAAAPRGGRIADRAAIALVRIRHPQGLQILEQVLSRPDCHVAMQESAAFGLRAARDARAVTAFRAAIFNASAGVRGAAVDSIAQVIDSFSRSSKDAAAALAESLALFLVTDPDADPDGVRAQAEKTLISNFYPSAEKIIREKLLKSGDERQCLAALRLLLKSGMPSARAAVTLALLKRDRPAGVYRALAAALKRTNDKKTKDAARIILAEKHWFDRCAAVLLPSHRKRRQARREAAQVILSC